MPTTEDKESTCRYFYCNYRYTKEEFIKKIQIGSKELYEKDKYDLNSLCEFSSQYILVSYFDLNVNATQTVFVKVKDGTLQFDGDKIKLTICKLREKSYLFNKTSKEIIKNKDFAYKTIFTFIRNENSSWNNKER